MLAERQDTLEQATDWLNAEFGQRPLPPLLVVIGLGRGALLDALDRRAPGTHVLALEPDHTAAPALLAGSGGRWRESGRLTYLTDPDYAGADEAWRMFPPNPDDHKVLVHPAVSALGREAPLRAAHTLKKIVFGARANAEARRAFAPLYLTNALRNLPRIAAGRDVRALTDVYRGTPAVIAGAGPSLDRTLPELVALGPRAVTIATDTALRPLLAAGIAPHFAIGVDPSARNARHFDALPPLDETWLVSETALDPRASRLFGPRTFWFRVADHHPWPWYRRLGLDAGTVDVWGSVLTAAFQVAVLAGCDPIVLIGADLSYPGGQPYARGTSYEFDWAYSAALGHDLSHAWSMQRAMLETIHVPDVRGDETVTTAPLQAFRDWMLVRAARSGRRVINASGEGILFGAGIEQAALHEALPARAVVPPVARVIPAGQPIDHGLAGTLATAVREVRSTLDIPNVPADPLAAWVDFTCGGFNVAAVADALDDAAQGLDTAVSSDAAGPIDPGAAAQEWPSWRTFRSATARGPIFTQLREGIESLRAMLATTAAGQPRDVSADSTLGAGDGTLLDALTLLETIAGRLHAMKDDGPRIEWPRDAGHTPVSGLADWPQDVSWPMLVFESLVGFAHAQAAVEQDDAAAAEAATTPADTFFTRHAAVPDRDVVPQAVAAGPLTDRSAIALARLSFEWVWCALRLEPLVPGSQTRFAGLIQALARGPITTSPDSAGREGPDPVLIVERTTEKTRDPQSNHEPAALRIPIPVDEWVLARGLTGALLSSARSAPLASLSGGGQRASIALRLGGASRPEVVDGHAGLMLHPRVLTDEGLARVGAIATSEHGVLCPLLHRSESVIVQEDGRITAHHTWPLPIVGELPWGATGATAWSNGTSRLPELGPGVVMWRESPQGPVFTEELPFRPTVGAWYAGRVYWSTYPIGFGSWAPGEAAVFERPDLRLLAVHEPGEDPDAGLRLDPAVRCRDNGYRRRPLSQAWSWKPGQSLIAVPLDERGACARQATTGRWTAAAFPDVDRILLSCRDGVARELVCYYPIGVAWAGGSLAVATHHGELLLFEGLVDTLDHLTSGGAH